MCTLPGWRSAQGMVVAAVLAVTEFFPEQKVIPRAVPDFHLVGVHPNGLCFWSCLFLACGATAQQKWLWYHRPRGDQGYPTSSENKEYEAMLVDEWLLTICDDDTPKATLDRIRRQESAVHEDFDSWFEFRNFFGEIPMMASLQFVWQHTARILTNMFRFVAFPHPWFDILELVLGRWAT